MSRETDLFYKAYITNEGTGRHGDAGRKPVPRKEGREKKEGIVLHLNLHEYLKSNKENYCKKNRIQ
jgi:hypothetical protein